MPGSWVEYDVSSQPGVFNQSTGEISVTMVNAPGYSIRVTALAYPNGQIYRALGPVGVVPDPNGVLGGWLEASTGIYIGEIGDGRGTTLTSPEPLLAVNPVPGEAITITTAVSSGGSLTEVYRTVSVMVLTSAPPQHVVKTTLVERPDSAPRAYTMEFDGELKSHIFGDVKPDGTVDATVWVRTRMGSGP